jgi:hypothetical protein
MQAFLLATREVEEIQAQEGADGRLLELVCQKKQKAKEEFLIHVVNHGCLSL